LAASRSGIAPTVPAFVPRVVPSKAPAGLPLPARCARGIAGNPEARRCSTLAVPDRAGRRTATPLIQAAPPTSYRRPAPAPPIPERMRAPARAATHLRRATRNTTATQASPIPPAPKARDRAETARADDGGGRTPATTCEPVEEPDAREVARRRGEGDGEADAAHVEHHGPGADGLHDENEGRSRERAGGIARGMLQEPRSQPSAGRSDGQLASCPPPAPHTRCINASGTPKTERALHRPNLRETAASSRISTRIRSVRPEILRTDPRWTDRQVSESHSGIPRRSPAAAPF